MHAYVLLMISRMHARWYDDAMAELRLEREERLQLQQLLESAKRGDHAGLFHQAQEKAESADADASTHLGARGREQMRRLARLRQAFRLEILHLSASVGEVSGRAGRVSGR